MEILEKNLSNCRDQPLLSPEKKKKNPRARESKGKTEQIDFTISAQIIPLNKPVNLQGGSVITTKDFLQGCVSVPSGRSGVAQLSLLIKQCRSFLQVISDHP